MECGQCGAGLSVPRGARSVQCAHCRGVTRVQRHGHGAVGFVMNAIANMAGGGGRPVTPPRLREYPRVHGDKRALLIGVNYTGTEGVLSGPKNDVEGMSFLLTQKYGFPKQCILTLTGK